MPDRLEDHALLRVHPRGFRIGDPEETGIETVDILHETTAANIGFPRLDRVRIVEIVARPAVLRDICDQIAAFG